MWVTTQHNGAVGKCWHDAISVEPPESEAHRFTEYVTRTHCDAMVAAAYEAVAKDMDCGCESREKVLSSKTKIERWYACGFPTCGALEAKEIRALTPTDAAAALDRIVKEAKAEAYREAAKHILRTQLYKDETTEAWVNGNNSGVKASAHAIRALSKQEAN